MMEAKMRGKSPKKGPPVTGGLKGSKSTKYIGAMAAKKSNKKK
jgi:hypothetical protein